MCYNKDRKEMIRMDVPKQSWFVDEKNLTVIYSNNEKKCRKLLEQGCKPITEAYALYLLDCHYGYGD